MILQKITFIETSERRNSMQIGHEPDFVKVDIEDLFEMKEAIIDMIKRH
jgi:hypothetical protein